jgi:hypothetical protein
MAYTPLEPKAEDPIAGSRERAASAGDSTTGLAASETEPPGHAPADEHVGLHAARREAAHADPQPVAERPP